MLSNVAARLPELAQATPEEKADIMDPLVDTIIAQITHAVANVSREQQKGAEQSSEEIRDKMDETAAMAGGAVAGFAGGAWNTGDKKNEKKRRTSSRV